jgi:hypothetical protein
MLKDVINESESNQILDHDKPLFDVIIQKNISIRLPIFK